MYSWQYTLKDTNISSKKRGNKLFIYKSINFLISIVKVVLPYSQCSLSFWNIKRILGHNPSMEGSLRFNNRPYTNNG